MPGWDLAHAQDGLNVHVVLARRHFFAWAGQIEPLYDPIAGKAIINPLTITTVDKMRIDGIIIVVQPIISSQKSRNVRKRTFVHVRPSDSDQHAPSRSLIRIFTRRILGRQGYKVSSCGQRRLRSDCTDAHADLSLRWTHMSEGTFSHIAAQIRWHFIHRLKLCTNKL